MDIVNAHRPKVSPDLDQCTNSNYKAFTVHSTKLHLDVDFDEKLVRGTVEYELSLVETTEKLHLDTSYLAVREVKVNQTEAKFVLNPRINPVGSKLSIDLPKNLTHDCKFTVSIQYTTTKDCTALQFLDKLATDGKVAPYLFCQCQANHARSLLPCFDTPSVKSPYQLSATSPYFVLMSGRPVKQVDNTYYFDQPIPIPSYLLSIASGDLVKAKIGPRSDVYSEPCNIEGCKWEFEKDMEDFIQIAEKLIFDYEWLKFDSLVLPQSFPYGGMEIPNLCQLTPTLICKDRSQVSVMAHELAHSWSGNLVTNCSWSHFWLNEGWTVYIERRIIEGIATAEARATGKPNPEQYGESMRQFSAIIGWTDLENSIKSMGENASKYSKLILNQTINDDPDDSFSTVPYEKGFNFLFYLEQLLGGKKAFDPFIPYYFKKFRYKSLDSYQFIDTLYEFFHEKKNLLDSIDWETWLYKPGMPPKPEFDTTLADECYNLADKWYHGSKNSDFSQFDAKDVADFHPNQSVVFLDTLISLDKHDDFNWKDHQDALVKFEQVYPQYVKTLNTEVLFRYYLLQVTGESQEYCHKLGQWLGTVGRMKYVRPGYVLLNKVNHELAIEYFKKFEAGYHPICRSLVQKDLGLA
jgi:leukotriene-A4 hydrolase